MVWFEQGWEKATGGSPPPTHPPKGSDFGVSSLKVKRKLVFRAENREPPPTLPDPTKDPLSLTPIPRGVGSPADLPTHPLPPLGVQRSKKNLDRGS